MGLFYILDEEGDIVHEPDTLKASLWRESNFDACRIARTCINDEVFLSTVFLVIDHNFRSLNDPILFESMWFGISDEDSDKIQSTRRYRTREEALLGHTEMLREYCQEKGLDLSFFDVIDFKFNLLDEC